jgi:hypothetical protein
VDTSFAVVAMTASSPQPTISGRRPSPSAYCVAVAQVGQARTTQLLDDLIAEYRDPHAPYEAAIDPKVFTDGSSV